VVSYKNTGWCCSNALGLCSEGAQFKSRLGHQLF
jgi:hypothetical protein